MSGQPIDPVKFLWRIYHGACIIFYITHLQWLMNELMSGIILQGKCTQAFRLSWEYATIFERISIWKFSIFAVIFFWLELFSRIVLPSSEWYHNSWLDHLSACNNSAKTHFFIIIAIVFCWQYISLNQQTTSATMIYM